MQKRRKTLEEVITRMEEDVARHMDAVEASSGTKMAAEVCKANALRRSVKAKRGNWQHWIKCETCYQAFRSFSSVSCVICCA